MSSVLENKTVLITGVTGGIGYEICKKYYQKNSKLVLIGRNNDSLAEIAKEFNAEYFCCDFSNLDEVEKIATSTLANSFLNDSNFIGVRPRGFAKSLDLLLVLFAILIFK